MESALSTIGLINSCLLLPFVKIPAETLLSIHDSPFPTDDQDTVGTFPAPPDPTGKVYCPLAPPPPPPPPPPPSRFLVLLITDVAKPIGH